MKMFIVKYCGGDYYDYYSYVIFVTADENKAIKYVTKFNTILKKWKEYYSRFEKNDEHVEKHFDRWYSLSRVTRCSYDVVDVR
jgi:hypothetical protein